MPQNRRQKRKRELDSLERASVDAYGRLRNDSSDGGQRRGSRQQVDTTTEAYRELAASRKLAKTFSAVSLQRHAQVNFTQEEQRQLAAVLKQYRSYGYNTEELVHNLKVLLDTPAKRQAILSVRNQVPSHQLALFDRLVILQQLWPPHAGSSRPTSRTQSPKHAQSSHQSPSRFPAAAAAAATGRGGAGHPGESRAHRLTSSFRQDKVKPVKITVTPDEEGSLGFDIRGGAEHGLGIFVCSVEESSEAHEKGVRVGHVIRKANGVNFQRISRDDAIEVLTDGSVKKIRLTVLPLGGDNNLSPASGKQPFLYYTWVNRHGRSTSPPPEYAAGVDLLHPNARLPKDNLRKMNLARLDGDTLGLSIRGGLEHGLGVYVSDIQRNSQAHNYGLMVGDQIVDVNGVSFLNILHNEAAEMLRENEMLVMTLRSLGKLPERPIVPFDNLPGRKRRESVTGGQTRKQPVALPEPVPARSLPRRGLFLDSQQQALEPNSAGQSQAAKSPLRQEPSAVFKPGFGRQLMFKGFQHAVHQSARASIEQQAKVELSKDEMATLGYYLDEYSRQNLTIRQLVTALIQLFNTPAKKRLLSAIRSIVQPKDIDGFEKLVAPVEYQAMKDSRLADNAFYDEDDDMRVVDNLQFGISTFGGGAGRGDDDLADVAFPGGIRQDGEGQAPGKGDGDSDSIECHAPMSHHNSRMQIQMSDAQMRTMEDDLQTRLGSLVAVDSEGGSLTRNNRPPKGFENSDVFFAAAKEIIAEDVNDDAQPLFANEGSDSTIGSTMEDEYDIQAVQGRRPSDIGIATASSSVQMVQLQPVAQSTPAAQANKSQSTTTAALPPIVAQHRSVLALKPFSLSADAHQQPQQAESPFVERRDSPRKIVQSQASVRGRAQDRGGTLDGAELDIPLLTSTPLHGGMGGDNGGGMFPEGDDSSSAAAERDIIADTVRLRRLRIHPDSTANMQSLLPLDSTEVTVDEADAINPENAADRPQAATAPGLSHDRLTVVSGDDAAMSASNSFDMPDNVQLQTRYVYNDTSEMGTMPEIQYTDTDF